MAQPSTRYYQAGLVAMLGAACSGRVGDAFRERLVDDAGGASDSRGGPVRGGHVGDIDGGGSAPVTVGDGPDAGRAAPEVPFAPAGGGLKRLTSTQFRSALTDLLGDVTVDDLEPDTWVGGFATVGAASVSSSPRGVEQYVTAIEGATAQLFANKTRRDAFIGCTPDTSAQGTSCLRAFVTRFGRLAWRAPLVGVQIDRYTALGVQLTQTLGDPVEAVRGTTNAMLSSPYFLYRPERGEPAPGLAWWRFTAHEMATRVAYFLTNSSPDGQLYAAADRGELTTVDGVRQQSERLLSSPRGRAAVGNFVTELFQVSLIASRAKDTAMFPSYTPALQSAMAREVPAMLESLVFDRQADAMEMFTTRDTFANRELAQLYGVATAAMTSTTWQPVKLPSTGPRAGILGTAGFLSLYASQKEGSPTTRGKFIRQFFMCQEIPDPPPNVSTNIPDPPAGVVLTKRERLAQHRALPSCAGCHRLMDPLGLPLEVFDAIGGVRSTDQGRPIDLTGDLDGVAFDGPVALGALLGENPETAACLARNVYRYGSGHTETEGETPVLERLTRGFAASHHDLRALMTDIVASDGFRFVAPPELP